MAIALANAGADIVSIQRSSENQETANTIRAAGRQCWIVECDLGNKPQVKGVVKKVMDDILSPKGKSIDIVINCGGIQRRTPAENFPDADWEEVMQVNLDVVFTLCRDAGKVMLDARRGAAAPLPKGKSAYISADSLYDHSHVAARSHQRRLPC